MPFFKRILKPADEPRPVTRPERRGGRRHVINPEFPLLSVLSFSGRDIGGNPATSKRAAWNWKGRLVDFSEAGARMQLAPSVLAASGDFCDLRLNLEGFALVVPCHITNMRVEREGVFFGLKHDITDELTRDAYRQLLEIVALGATLKPRTKTPKLDESGYLVELYASDLPSRLKVWRQEAGHAVAAFEFLLKDSLVRAAQGQGLEYLPGAAVAPGRRITPAQATEIQRLFHWVVPNLAPAVPDDVRKFLRRYAD
jgi:hypothetical protein